MKKKDFVGKVVSCRTVDNFGRVNVEYTHIKKVSGKQLISKDATYICDITQLGTEIQTPAGTKSFELVE